jgi:hypothetical protein
LPAWCTSRAKAVPQAPAPRTAIWEKTGWSGDKEGAIKWGHKIVGCLFGREIYLGMRN